MTNIDQIIKTLTLDEKVSLLSGFNSWYTNKIEKKKMRETRASATSQHAKEYALMANYRGTRDSKHAKTRTFVHHTTIKKTSKVQTTHKQK